MISTIGALISAASAIYFCYVLYKTFSAAPKCADNPWGEGATTLEWTVSSPPPFHTFEELPQVR
jgi:cytochrome c oxidase subunit 1